VLAKVGQRDGKVVHSNGAAVSEKMISAEDLDKPSKAAEAENSERTRLALQALASGKASSAHGALERAVADKKEPTYIKYTPSSAQASGATNRVIRMVEAPSDPMEPPKFKHKRVPRGPPSPPAPVMHSPPRKITLKDQQDWKIPPCISNWKNIKGYTIPLDKRLAADGRGLQEVQISDNFAKLSEALYVAERNARDEVDKRATIRRRIAAKDKEAKEEELRLLAQRAREERGTASVHETMEAEPSGDSGAMRDEMRDERKRVRDRERRLENRDGKRSHAIRDADRDVSERIALGQAVPSSNETLFDQRLFNQVSGVTSGFNSDDASYNVYDKSLFRADAGAQALYRPTDIHEDDWGNEDVVVDKVAKVARFTAADRDAGKQLEGSRGQPVAFEQADEADPFGLGEFLSEARRGKA